MEMSFISRHDYLSSTSENVQIHNNFQILQMKVYLEKTQNIDQSSSENDVIESKYGIYIHRVLYN